ncbi:MAG: hypothetical protein ACLFS2_02435 [Halochromatium sp.]|uniref:hypothetical protein n=1 Tax=Halochromatium sp. TaxID=2049430 RepID=UPI00397D954D
MEFEAKGGVNGADMGNGSMPGSDPTRASATQADRASWFEAMARAWGSGLDKEAEEVVQLSDEMQSGEGDSDEIGNQVEFQAQVQRMSFMSEAASNSVKTGGEALSSLARRN